MPPTDSPEINPADAPTPAADLSRFIRTYAKDVAQVSGKGNVGALQKAKAAPAPVQAVTEPEKSKDEVGEGVALAATEQPFLGSSSLPQKEVPAPVAVAEREAVLTRLRAKMAASKIEAPTVNEISLPAAPVSVAPPVFAAPAPAPVFAIPPVYREPIPEAVPKQSPAPLPKVALPAPATQTGGPSPFHSFSTDFKDLSKAKNASSFTVLAAGLDAGQAVSTPEVPKRTKPPLLAISLGIILLALASGGSYALYLYVGARHEVPVITLRVPSLIFTDEYKKLEGAGKELMQALATSASDPLLSGTARVTYIGYPATGEAGTLAGAPAPGGFLIQALALPAPDLLTRNIDESSTVGIINEGGDARAFLVLRVSSYERTFAGMLTWEPLMTRDLGLLYPMYPEDEVLVPQVDLGLVAGTEATTSLRIATTTAPAPVAQTSPAVSVGRFEDAIVANRDVRILRDTRGRSLMLYGYADKETLIIARNEAAFAALLVRLSAGGK